MEGVCACAYVSARAYRGHTVVCQQGVGTDKALEGGRRGCKGGRRWWWWWWGGGGVGGGLARDRDLGKCHPAYGASRPVSHKKKIAAAGAGAHQCTVAFLLAA